jgi:lipopolysaccharide transport system permease protein
MADFSSRPVTETVYAAGYLRGQGWCVWQTMVRDILSHRGLIWHLAVRDVSVRYRQSFFGYLWAILLPVPTVAVFAFLAKTQTIPIGETSFPYVVYALWSLGVWQLFAGCLMACTNSLVNTGSLVGKINFPKEALVTAAMGLPLFDFVVRLVAVTIVFLWYEIAPKWQLVFLPLTVIPAVFLALGLGLILSLANLVLRDVGHILGVVLTFGTFLSPVLYPPPARWPFSLINIANPFSPLLIASQDLIAHGALTMPAAFLISCVCSTVVFLFGWRLFRVMMPRVAQHA